MSGLMSGLDLGVNWRRRLSLLSIVAGSQRLAVAQRVGRCGEGRRGGFKCYHTQIKLIKLRNSI